MAPVSGHETGPSILDLHRSIGPNNSWRIDYIVQCARECLLVICVEAGFERWDPQLPFSSVCDSRCPRTRGWLWCCGQGWPVLFLGRTLIILSLADSVALLDQTEKPPVESLREDETTPLKASSVISLNHVISLTHL